MNETMWKVLQWELANAILCSEIEMAGLHTGTESVAEMSHGDPFAVGLFAVEYQAAMHPKVEELAPVDSPAVGGYL